MGILADLYVATEDEAARYDGSPDGFPHRLESKRITGLELSTLWALMRDVEWSAGMMDDFPLVMERDEGEVYVLRLPDAMTATLARIPPDQLSVAAAKWVATEEMAGSSAEDIRPFLEALVGLARKATETERSIYLWNSV